MGNCCSKRTGDTHENPHLQKEGDEVIFRLDTDYVRKAKEKWTSEEGEKTRDYGKVSLPYRKDITRVSVDVEAELAAEVTALNLKGNTVAKWTPTEAYNKFTRLPSFIDDDGEMTFRLDTNYIRKELEKAIAEDGTKMSYYGRIGLPGGGVISRVIVDVDAEVAAEVNLLDMNNPVITLSPPSEVTKFMGMKQLSFYGCKLGAVPNWVEPTIAALPSNRSSIEHLNLGSNDLRLIPPSLLEIQSLKRLWAFGNENLQTIPSGRYLTEVYINSCDIQFLPRDFFSHRLEKVNLNGNKGLKHLPSLPPTSPLKQLKASNCGLELIHETFVRPGISMDLANNKIIELPREKMLKFLQSGGDLVYDQNGRENGGISIKHNPMVYPPRYILEQGVDATIQHLTLHENSMIDTKEMSVILIGNETAGKTSLGLSLAGSIFNAAEVKRMDRTVVFDCYKATIMDTKLTVIDVGGHDEYRLQLSILGRDNGMYVSVINPSDFDNEERMIKAVGAWIDRILEGVMAPHFIFVITKIDTMVGKDKRSKMESMSQTLVQFLKSKAKTLAISMTIRKAQLEEQLQCVETQLVEQHGKAGAAQDQELLEEQRLLGDKISRHIKKMNNPPNFNLDKITFVSSVTKEGFNKLEENITTVVARVPKVLLQDAWMAKITALLTNYEKVPFIKFDDFLKDKPRLPEVEVISLLEGMNAVGRVIWSKVGRRKDIIFHKLENLAIINKSIFHHEMSPILDHYAKLKKLEHPDMLKVMYRQGLIPLQLIRSMFEHICNSAGGKKLTIKMDYNELRLFSPNIENQAFDSFFEMLIQLNIIQVVKVKHENVKMVLAPYLVSQKPSDIDKHIWNITTDQLELGALFTFNTLLSKSIFSKCCSLSVHLWNIVAKLIGTELIITSRVGAQVVKFGNYEALIQHLTHTVHEKPWPYPTDQFKNGHSGLLLLLRIFDDVCPDSGWVYLREVASKLELELQNLIGDCQLVCPKAVTGKDCHHGPFFPNSAKLDSHETIQATPILRRKIPKCKNCPGESLDITTCFPSEAAVDIMGCLMSKGADSPFYTPTPPEESCLAISNILTVISTQKILDLAVKIKKHPALLSAKEKFFIVRAVRQYFDNMEECQAEPKHKICRCYLSETKYVDSFTLLEDNSCIVTKGDWKTPMQSISDKYELGEQVTGNGSSATALARAYRNYIAHFDLSEKQLLEFLDDMDKAFRWAIMHFFSFQELIKPDRNPSLREFALVFKDFQTAERKELVEGPVNPLLLVEVSYADDAKPCRKSLFYADPDKNLETLKREVSLRFVLPVNEQKMEYIGFYKSGVEPHFNQAIELKKGDSLSMLDLNTKHTHLIHVTQDLGRQLEVEVTLILGENEQKIKKTTFTKKSVSDVSTMIQIEHGVNNELFFIPVGGNVCIGYLCKNEEVICNITALDKNDEKRKKEFVGKIKVVEEKEDVFADDDEDSVFGAMF